MANKDKDGKLTYQMTSPGQAWMDYVNSREGHNANAVTPAYLEPSKQPDKQQKTYSSYVEARVGNEKQSGVNHSKSYKQEKSNQHQKDIEHEH